MLRLSLLSLFCCTLLISCAQDDRVGAESQTSLAESLAQELPISAQVEIGGETIKLEVAQTQRQQTIGLMYREELPNNRGMLFPMNPPRVPQFWMKNVKIPLDMIFVREGEVRAIAHSVPPCEKDPCPTYTPQVMIDQVIELRGGRAKELGLEIGDALKIYPVANDELQN